MDENEGIIQLSDFYSKRVFSSIHSEVNSISVKSIEIEIELLETKFGKKQPDFSEKIVLFQLCQNP